MATVTCLREGLGLRILANVGLGANIRSARERAGFGSQAALARAMLVPQTRVWDWENDRYQALKLQTCIAIAKACRVSVDTLLAGYDPDYDAMLRTLDPVALEPVAPPHLTADAVRVAEAWMEIEEEFQPFLQGNVDVFLEASRLRAALRQSQRKSPDPQKRGHQTVVKKHSGSRKASA